VVDSDNPINTLTNRASSPYIIRVVLADRSQSNADKVIAIINTFSQLAKLRAALQS